jgi:tetratricopeptide (TPR) repeat protein
MGDRAVYCARLESVCAEKHPGFESPPIRRPVCLALRGCFGKDVAMRLVTAFFCLAAAPLHATNEMPPPGVNMVERATNDYEAGKFEEAIVALDQFDKPHGPTAESLDLRGVIYMERGQFDQATKAFRAAHDADRTLFSPRIHLGEVLFREKKYAEAREVYESLLKETNVLISNERLRYAVFLTYLAAHDDASARGALNRIKFPTETPVYYYAQAAWEFAQNRKGDAQKWINTAGQIFDPKNIAWCARPLYDFGWLKKKPALVAP